MALLYPKDPKKLKTKLRRYERELRQDQKKHGGYLDDSGGKRYALGPMYLLLDDTKGALKSFAWFEKTCPDDVGEPEFFLCWTLALYRAGETEAATRKLQQTMLSNLYLIPYLLGQAQPEYTGIRHSSNLDQADYIAYIPAELFALWDDAARQWASEQYHGPELSAIHERYIEIEQQLNRMSISPQRSTLVEESFRLRDGETP